jgi:hypothetical protein
MSYRALVAAFVLSAILSPFTHALEIGAATRIINNEVGGWVQGAGVAKQATEIRDDLEANALYFNDGKMPLLIISCDLVGLPSEWVVSAREAIAQATGVPPRNVLITCTHTHGGPSLLKTNYLMPVDTAYLHRLHNWLVEVSKSAVQSAQPGAVGWANGEAQIGYNRRVCWADGTHSMHGDTTRPDFAGLEGPVNPQHLALFAVDATGKPVAVLHHNTTHPTIFYAAGVYSADFPGRARELVREALGDIPVLFLNGAQGDIAIQDQMNNRKESREETLERIGRMVAEETLRLHKEITYHEAPILGHAHKDLEAEVRLPEAQRLADSREVLARIDAGEKVGGMDMIMAFGAVDLQARFGDNPVDTVPVHALRIGDLALVTQPCELYCQFGLDIARRSPAEITAVVGLADGYCGYCPTIYGVLGGGYSAAPISWTRLEPYTGYRIVETAGVLLNQLWRDQGK